MSFPRLSQMKAPESLERQFDDPDGSSRCEGSLSSSPHPPAGARPHHSVPLADNLEFLASVQERQ